MHAHGTLSHLICIKSPLPLQMRHLMQQEISHNKALSRHRSIDRYKKSGICECMKW
ncbi:MAG: hypothetical protein HOC24_07045 [Deltaproteobacteria bacterium]|nr:hypothetical protein [Deltaproteobacteria bacterium]